MAEVDRNFFTTVRGLYHKLVSTGDRQNPDSAPKTGQPKTFWGGWQERLRALRNIPPLMKIVWESGRAVVAGGLGKPAGLGADSDLDAGGDEADSRCGPGARSAAGRCRQTSGTW